MLVDRVEILPIEFKNQRIMTIKTLAEEYGTDEKNIQMNYLNNQSRFSEGKHYFKLEGQYLKDFKNSLPNEIREPLKFASQLILWTEKGAARHAKLLNTDEAWEVYETLEETYFRVKENNIAISQLSPELQMFKTIFDKVAQQELEQKQIVQAVEQTKEEVQAIRETITNIPEDWREFCVKVIRKIAYKNDIPFNLIQTESYQALQNRTGCRLEQRLLNRRKRALEYGANKAVVDKMNFLDAIQEDKKLVEIYLGIIKQMAIKYKVA